MNSQQQYDFRRARDQYTVQLRKQNRQQIFYKRRHTTQPIITQNKYSQNKQDLIVDPQLSPAIQNIMKEQFQLNDIPQLCATLQSQDTYLQHRAVIGLRKLISQRESTEITQKIIDKGAVVILINLMRQSKRPQLQLQSTWILSNIASGSHAQCQSIIDKNGLDAFLHLLYENKPGVCEQALWGIGNIAGDCPAFRDMILIKGGLECLIRLVQNTKSIHGIQLGIWAISNLCRGTPLPQYDLIKPAIPVLARAVLTQVLQGQNLSDCLWALASHSESQKSRIQRLVQVQGFVQKILQISKVSQVKQILLPCLRIIGNISSGNQKQTDKILQAGAVQVLNQLLQNKIKIVRREICWIISNICAGSHKQIQQIILNRQLLIKITYLFFEQDLSVKRQICFIFANMTRISDMYPVFDFFAECHILEGLIMIIDQDEDARSIQVALQTLDDILSMDCKLWPTTRPLYKKIIQIPGFAQRLQLLQHHQSKKIYVNVVRLLQKHFILEEEPF